MRRKFTFPVEPPGAHQPVAGRQRGLHRGIGGFAGLHHRPGTDRGVHLARHRVAHRVAATRVRCLVDEHHAVRHQPFVGGDAVVGESSDDLAIVVAVVGKAVGFDDRPIGEVVEHQVGRVLDAMLPLCAGAAAERNVAAAGDGMAADMRFGFDDDNGSARLAGGYRGGDAGRASTDDNDVASVVKACGRRHRADAYMSRTRRSLLHPAQQIITLSFAACSSSLSTESRCSGMPEMTRVTHSPQMPSSHE